MNRILRRLSEPAEQSHLGMALGVAGLAMALLLWAVLWQATVIAQQREVIRTLWRAHSGG